MKNKIKLELTHLEIGAILNIITTIEGMFGCSDTDSSNDLNDFDTQMKKDIKKFDSMLKRNGFKRK